MSEIRVSPDFNAVAITSAHADGPFAGYSVMHDTNGGHWEPTLESRLADWMVVPTSAIGEPSSDARIRVSPDGHSVAVKSAYPDGFPAAGFGIAHDYDGQNWENNVTAVADWHAVDTSQLVAPTPAPQADQFDTAGAHDVIEGEVIPDHPELDAAHPQA